ncbi:MAG: hypothetical protein ACOC11_00410 [Prolixibacteraceae bacterium]
MKNIFKIKPRNKKYVRLVAGIIILAFGAVFMVVPFIPLGYAFLFAGLFLLASYIPPLNKVLDKIRKKDEKGRVEKVEQKIDEGEKMVDEKMVDGGENDHTSEKTNKQQ